MNEKIFGHSLIVGILLLTVTSISSLLLIFSLEKEVKTRSQALKAQHRAGDIDRALMEWMIYRLIAEKSKSEDPDSELASRLKHKVEVIQKDLEMSVIHDPIQFKRSQELKKNWGHFVQNLEDSGSRTEIRKLIRDIESYEQNKIDHFSPNINYKIKIMTVASIILLFASLIIVIQSFKNLKQKKLQQEEIIANLERSKKAADESSKLKSKFVATVSHEIRTPINGIVGATQVFSNHNLDETQKKLLRAINHSSKTLLNLVNELLDFSKLEAQKIQIQTKPIDLYAFCNEVIETMGWKAEEKNLKFYFDIDFDVHQFVLADENLLKQVIINLVGNALKFTNMGRVVLKIQMSNDHFKFIVEDTGIGISNDHIEKIFNPFFQSNQDSVYNEPGTGIGLTISQRLVQAMGGQIKVESVINKGTRFYFEIPLESLDEHKFKKDSPARLGFKNALQGFQILVAEDNETNRLVCSEIIKNQGAQATVVKNGQEAVDVASQKGFDVILLDCQMPILDGYKAAQAIRKINIDVPILALTANVSEENRKKCLMSGMNGFIGKPLSPSDLVEAISRINPKVKSRLSSYNLKDSLSLSAQKKIAQSFVLTLKELNTKLNQPLSLEELKKIGHQYKSSSKLLGEHQFSESCLLLENASSLSQALSVSKKIQADIPDVISHQIV